MRIDSLGHHLHLLPELAKLHFNEWKHLSADTTLEDRVLKLRAMAQSSDLPLMFVATHDHGLVGSAALVREDMRTRKDLSPWLASVFVKPEFRHHGTASRLVRYIEGEATRRGISKLFLFTEHARDLYLKLGWFDLEQCEYQGVNVTVMFKELAA